MPKKSLAQTYQKKTDREHILDAPDTYLGSIIPEKVENWTFNDDNTKIVNKEIAWVPGFYKCFDEALVNARDHVVRMEQNSSEDKQLVKNIQVTISQDQITLMNDGDGIDIEKHPDHNIWIPELVFGHLRTSTNYDKEEKKIVGGKNGFGFKLVLIYSQWGEIETVDHRRGLKYIQRFENNLTKICPPTITKCKGKKPYTKVTYMPDYERFGIKQMTDDITKHLTKRVHDIAGVTNPMVKVTLNSKQIPIKNFQQYIDMYIGSSSDTKRLYHKENDRWEVAICLTPFQEFTQVSFVNGINTKKGGKHVDYVLNMIIKKVVALIEKKKKVKVKPATIKEQLMLFVNCTIENPSFDSQTKEFLTTNVSNFGSSCDIPDSFIDKLIKMGIMEQALSINEIKEQKEIKKADGKKLRSVRGIPKLIDANFAGSDKGNDCTLILCEGDSAKAGIVSGLSKEDRNRIGIYPLKGKLMNVRGELQTTIAKNDEISDIKKILGLEVGKAYTKDEIDKKLRYGHIMFMTDQDLDGIHIKGLGINLFASQWHELSKIPQFLSFMNTPILKAKKGKQEKLFYYDNEYQTWKQGKTGWTVKYYKGLGTSTAKEFKEYFKHQKKVVFEYDSDKCDKALDMVFNKKKADERKEWLGSYDKTNIIDTDTPAITFDTFVNKELIHYSKYDNERSLPNIIDGLKTSQRKILYAAFKRNLVSEIKVAQFGGYISEHSGYHHGEASLMKAIVGMAQEFTGANNISLFMPNGQFGTRLQGGKDSASERYIFTQLSNITKCIFPASDLDILSYIDDDGSLVEPEFYVPIIPMILVNGAKGIGTGFSTDIPNYNPIELIDYLMNKITTPSFKKPLTPYFEGFKGVIEEQSSDKFITRGIWKLIKKDCIHVTELPIGMWTETYKQFLEKIIIQGQTLGEKKGSILRDYKDMSTDAMVDFTLMFSPGKLDISTPEAIAKFEKDYHLTSSINTSNMYLFNEAQKILKYKNVEEIIDNFYGVRRNYYHIRKQNLLEKLNQLVNLLSNKYRFIKEQIDDKLDLRGKKMDDIVKELTTRKYDVIDGNYKYLISMPISSVIKENLERLKKDREEKLNEMKELEKTEPEALWYKELEILKIEYERYIKQRINRVYGDI
jgi:DNA topoisomerase II